MSMTRIIILSGIAGSSISAIGYDIQAIVHGTASALNYVYLIGGVIGLLSVWLYIRWLKKKAATDI
jgi:uncharacterized membrane protein YuzA (DUF378 family)